jgi:hypothetical protein
LNNDVNVPSNQKEKPKKTEEEENIFLRHLVSHGRKKQDPDPKGSGTGTDPQHCVLGILKIF